MRAVNLIPVEHRKGGAVGRRSQGAAFAVLVLLAGVGILVFTYGTAMHQVESRQAEAATLSARARKVQTEAAVLTPYTSFIQTQEQRMQEIASLINSRFDWSSAMGEFSRVLPAGVALTSLQATVGQQSASASAASTASPSSSSGAAAAGAGSVSSATPTGATPTFTLEGCAVSQIVVAQTLVRLRLMSGVSNVTLQNSSKSESGGGSSSGSCPSGAPVFSIDVTYQPLPSPPSTSVEALESTASAHTSGSSSSSGGSSAKADAKSVPSNPRRQTVSNGPKGAAQ
jgi:hypothetical protein